MPIRFCLPKVDWVKNRLKIRKFAEISRVYVTRAWGGKIQKKSPKNRPCDMTIKFVIALIKRSRFHPLFQRHPTTIFFIQRLILNLNLDLTVQNDFQRICDD